MKCRSKTLAYISLLILDEHIEQKRDYRHVETVPQNLVALLVCHRVGKLEMGREPEQPTHFSWAEEPQFEFPQYCDILVWVVFDLILAHCLWILVGALDS